MLSSELGLPSIIIYHSFNKPIWFLVLFQFADEKMSKKKLFLAQPERGQTQDLAQICSTPKHSVLIQRPYTQGGVCHTMVKPLRFSVAGFACRRRQGEERTWGPKKGVQRGDFEGKGKEGQRSPTLHFTFSVRQRGWWWTRLASMGSFGRGSLPYAKWPRSTPPLHL